MAMLKNQTQVNELKSAPKKIEEYPKDVKVHPDHRITRTSNGAVIELEKRTVTLKAFQKKN